MSLGPPFDSSGEKLQQAVGAFVVLALAGAVAWVLLMSGRTIGRGLTVHVEMATPGLLTSGAKVRLAGREIGEVRSMTSTTLNGKRRGVDVHAFVLLSDAASVRQNSQVFVETPSILGEAYLEVGPPAGGAAPGPPVADGDRLRGIDPPQIDDLLAHSEQNLRLILALLRENRPELEELLSAGDDLLSALSGLPADRGQLHRIHDQFIAALESGRALAAALRDSNAVPRVRAIVDDLGGIAAEAGPELRRLSTRLDASLQRLDELAAVFSPERREQLKSALTSLRRAANAGQRVAADAKFLADYVKSGRGSVGAFFADQELFDDLHETHRILKSQPWTFILKPSADTPKKQPQRR
jgi:phospholipid/cholesterol/gamma-HCH transport system substrate-binding protein